MNWIRIDVGIMDDPRVGALAGALGVSVPLTTGHLVGVLRKLPTHAKDGDLARVPAATIELWAMWVGKRGKFAAALHAHLCTEQGVVRGWEKHNGSAIREADAARDRMKKMREERRMLGERSANNTRTISERSLLRDVTGRDVTNNNNNNQQIPAAADAPVGPRVDRAPAPTVPKPAAKYPGFLAATCDAAYDLWLERAGAVDYAQFRKAFGPAFAKREADRPTALPRDAELIPLVRLYLSAIRGTSGAKFVKPDACAKAIAQLAVALRTGESPEHRLALAQHALGLTDEIRRLARAA